MMKTRLVKSGIVVTCALVIAIAATAIAQRRGSAEDRPAGEQWEYLIVGGGNVNFSSSSNSSMRKETSGSFAREVFPLEANMDKLGAKGWELVTVYGSAVDPTFFYKRRR